MSSLRSQLPDSEALLLMYAVSELTPEDRAQVEAELAKDASLRQRLEFVCANLDLVGRRFDSVDAFNGFGQGGASVDHAVRRAVEAIRGWQLGRPVAEAAKPLHPPQRRWGWASAVAALIAVGLGASALISYLNPPTPGRMTQHDGLPELSDPAESPLALHAAATLAMGLDVEDDTVPASPMPAEPEEPIVSADRPFFDVPLIADADDGAP